MINIFKGLLEKMDNMKGDFSREKKNPWKNQMIRLEMKNVVTEKKNAFDGYC